MSDIAMNWHTIIINYLNANIPILLLGNKIDLIKQRVVPSYNGLELANEQKFIYTETSAKTGENVDNLFKKLAESLARPILDSYKTV